MRAVGLLDAVRLLPENVKVASRPAGSWIVLELARAISERRVGAIGIGDLGQETAAEGVRRVQAVQIDGGRFVAVGVEGDLGAIGERARVAGAGLGQRREVAGGGGVIAADRGIAREPEALAVVAQAEDHAAVVAGGDDLLQALKVQPSPKALSTG